MRIVSITWAHNEEGIIETFVRHNAAIVDEMIVVTHECTDNTERILHRLQQENLPLTVRQDFRPFHQKSPVGLSELLRSLAKDPTVTWVLPLDADELLCSTTGNSPRTELQQSDPSTLYALPWKTYVPTPQDDTSKSDIRERMQMRRDSEPIPFSKVLVPTTVAKRTHCTLEKGNHLLRDSATNTAMEAVSHPTLCLAHFPVRSDMQIRNKVLRMCAKRLADPTYTDGQSFHLFSLYDRCKDPAPISPEELMNIGLQYATKDQLTTSAVVHDPIPTHRQASHAKPVVEIHGPFFKNSGDHLMAYAITKQLEEHAVVCMKSDRGNMQSPRVIVTADSLRMYPNQLTGTIVDESDITAVIDCSGYAYSSVWNDDHIVTMAEQYRHWKHAGKSIVMFPQSFGPFYSKKAADAIREMVTLADCVYAREGQSYTYLRSVCGATDTVHIAPDFTAMVRGELPASQPPPHAIGIIPNTRMMDKTSDAIASSYLDFLGRCIGMLRSMDLNPILIQHERNDDGIIKELALQHAVPQYANNNPLQLKGFVASCKGVISSRYHGCVAALSEGVPVLATSWNHKYEDLFTYYNCKENILSVHMHDFQLERALEIFSSEKLHRMYSDLIRSRAQQHVRDVEKLWESVLPLVLHRRTHCG